MDVYRVQLKPKLMDCLKPEGRLQFVLLIGRQGEATPHLPWWSLFTFRASKYSKSRGQAAVAIIHPLKYPYLIDAPMSSYSACYLGEDPAFIEKASEEEPETDTPPSQGEPRGRPVPAFLEHLTGIHLTSDVQCGSVLGDGLQWRAATWECCTDAKDLEVPEQLLITSSTPLCFQEHRQTGTTFLTYDRCRSVTASQNSCFKGKVRSEDPRAVASDTFEWMRVKRKRSQSKLFV